MAAQSCSRRPRRHSTERRGAAVYHAYAGGPRGRKPISSKEDGGGANALTIAMPADPLTGKGKTDSDRVMVFPGQPVQWSQCVVGLLGASSGGRSFGAATLPDCTAEQKSPWKSNVPAASVCTQNGAIASSVSA